MNPNSNISTIDTIKHLAANGNVEEINGVISNLRQDLGEDVYRKLETTSSRLELTRIFNNTFVSLGELSDSRPNILKTSIDGSSPIDLDVAYKEGSEFETKTKKFIQSLHDEGNHVFANPQHSGEDTDHGIDELKVALTDEERKAIALKALTQLGGKDVEWLRDITGETINGLSDDVLGTCKLFEEI